VLQQVQVWVWNLLAISEWVDRMRGFRLVFLLASVAAAPLFLAAIQPEQNATTAAKFFIKIVAIAVPFSIGYMTLEDAARDKDIMWDENDSAFGIFSSSFFHKTKEFTWMMFMLTLGCMAVSAFRRSFEYGTLFPAV
jgi:hypothetical protein